MDVGRPVFADMTRPMGRRKAFQSAIEAAITIAASRPMTDSPVHLKTGCLRQNALMSLTRSGRRCRTCITKPPAINGVAMPISSRWHPTGAFESV